MVEPDPGSGCGARLVLRIRNLYYAIVPVVTDGLELSIMSTLWLHLCVLWILISYWVTVLQVRGQCEGMMVTDSVTQI